MIAIRTCGIVLAAALLSSPQTPSDAPRFKVAVDAVTFDAVVTDRDGHVVRDLTAEDFEIFQDGKRQKVAFAQFVPVLTAAATARRDGTAPLPSSAVAATAPPRVARENIQRTIALVADDLGLSAESMSSARRALHAFIDTALLPSDLVAVLRTGGSAGALPTFTTDHRILHAAIDRLRWNSFSRNGVEPFQTANSGKRSMCTPRSIRAISRPSMRPAARCRPRARSVH